MLISKYLNDNVEEKIAEIETRFNISLPNQYKTFLLKYNGGDTPNTRITREDISSDVRGFFGVGNVKRSFRDIDLKEWLEKTLFPIAYDSFGNHFVMGMDCSNFGKIYFYDHENVSGIKYIAKNVKDFFIMCNSEKINDASKLSIQEREAALIARGRGHIITDELRNMWQAEIEKYSGMTQEEVLID